MGRYCLKDAKEFLLRLLSFSTPQAIVIDLTIILLILAIIPTSKLYYLPVRSVYENVFGITLYSSGMTRALSRLMHLDPVGAWEFNKLAFIVFVVMIVLIVINLYKSIKNSHCQ